MDAATSPGKHSRAGRAGRAALLCLPIMMLFALSGTAVAQTTVSLTFDDGIATQYPVRQMLAEHGMHATFYVNSGRVGTTPYYMTWQQLYALAADGNEIGGHTLDHVSLTQVSVGEVQRQVCEDRAYLIGQGFSVHNFAYPFSRHNAQVESVVEACGYTTARRIGGLRGGDCPTCPVAESIPPAAPMVLRAPEWPFRPYELADLQGWVTQAEDNGGGWVPLVFHDICDGCGGSTVSAADLQAFLDWLAPREVSGTVAKTVREVAPPADGIAPQTAITCDRLPCSSAWRKAPVSVALSATDQGSGVESIHYTTDGAEPTGPAPTYAAPFDLSETATVNYRAFDQAGNVEPTQSQLVKVDAAAPLSTISCDGAACASGWYKGPVSVGLDATDEGSGLDAIRYTTDGSAPTAQSATYSSALQVTATTTVSYRAFDRVGNAETVQSKSISVQPLQAPSELIPVQPMEAPSVVDRTPPSIRIISPRRGKKVKSRGTVTLAARVRDASPIRRVRFLVDGRRVGKRVSPPYRIKWRRRRSPKRKHRITFVAEDIAGNKRASSVSVRRKRGRRSTRHHSRG